MGKWGIAFGLVTVATVLMIGWFMASIAIIRDAGTVGHTVVGTVDPGIEIRQYSNLTVISASSDSQDSAFTALSRYILGNNRNNTRIDMILPVITHSSGSVVNMSFILPEGYRPDNAPEPLDDDLNVSEIPSRKVAVLGFSGYAGTSACEEYRETLEGSLREHGTQTQGDYFLFIYAPPRTPPVLIRNEVAVEVI